MSILNSLGKGLAAIGLAEETQPQTPIISASVPIKNVAVAIPPHNVPVTSVITNPDAAKTAELDEMARSIIIKDLENDGAPLVEEYLSTLEPLVDIVPDERARTIAALKIVVKKGNSMSAILSDVDKSLGALEESKRKFDTNSRTQFEQKVGTKQASVANMDSQLSQKNEQLRLLQTEIADLAAKRTQEQSGISVEENKIALVQSRFQRVYTVIKSEIEHARSKIVQYGEGL